MYDLNHLSQYSGFSGGKSILARHEWSRQSTIGLRQTLSPSDFAFFIAKAMSSSDCVLS